MGGINNAARFRAVLQKDKRHDGLFYFASKTTKVYCRPSCSDSSPMQKDCLFFDAVEQAKLNGYQACKHCHPDRLKNNLSSEVLSNIDAGAINDKGVHGLAEELHISERHLRRIVRDRTGASPLQLNQAKRLSAAKRLILKTKLPIIEVAFNAEFSSLRQFNAAFKNTFKTSPRDMRKTVKKGMQYEEI
ncbi:MAG TPA: Ada metal-binding domain-containing protein [Patescibacteria group bacterium]|jgi:AraC family transcriptional regulator of adaptative response / DNA-3-methyladenine glycosylase II|nr:Ada metal-binding domain-containing protein [Patescibacteria group bacterium]